MPLLVSSLGLKDYISREMRILQCNNKTTNRGKQAGNKATGVNMDAFSEHLSAQTKVIIAKHKHMEAESIKHSPTKQRIHLQNGNNNNSNNSTVYQPKGTMEGQITGHSPDFI